MVRLTSIFLTLSLTALAGAVSVSSEASSGKTSAPEAAEAMESASRGPSLPRSRLAEYPSSLLQPAAETPYACVEPECRYFECDPLLDNAERTSPGWLFDVEMAVVRPHVLSRVGEFAPTAVAPFATAVPMGRLDWTVSPRFELGYRLPSGFGEIDVAYRFASAVGEGLSLQGSEASPDADATLRSRLSLQLFDADYASNEWSLGPCWGMKWRIGLRTADVFFDSVAEEPLAAAAGQGASGVYLRRISNDFWGIGPHATLELKRHRNDWGFGWVGRLDGGLLLGEVRQRFTQAEAPNGVGGVSTLSNPQEVPMISGMLGIDWRPPRWPNVDLMLGYTAEFWWNVGRLSDPDLYDGRSAGEMGMHGVVLRMEYNY